jgi:nucleotidyltransferase/DNA polymerase involved in DNA repair
MKRDNPELGEQPLILTDPEGRVFDVSTEAETCGVFAGMTSRAAGIRCPEARLLEADVTHCRAERETLLQLLEHASPKVESHGWGAAYVDLGELARDHSDAMTLCQEIGRSVRKELGEALQPALGWDSSKFTAQAAARRTQPGNILAIPAAQEQRFLQPLPVALLPLPEDVRQRLCFLGLRTLGQYAVLPVAAVWQQFGQAGKMAHRCARGEDIRPVVPRWQAPQLAAEIELETPLVNRERLMAELRRLVYPLLGELQENLQACGQVRLAVEFDDGSAQEKTRTFLSPLAEEGRIARALGQLLDGLHWRAAAVALAVTLGQIEDAVAEQLTLFPLEDECEGKLQEVKRYLAARFGAPTDEGHHLQRAVMAQPGAPLPEWRISWRAWGEL